MDKNTCVKFTDKGMREIYKMTLFTVLMRFVLVELPRTTL